MKLDSLPRKIAGELVVVGQYIPEVVLKKLLMAYTASYLSHLSSILRVDPLSRALGFAPLSNANGCEGK